MTWGEQLELHGRSIAVEPASWVGGVVVLDDGRWSLLIDGVFEQEYADVSRSEPGEWRWYYNVDIDEDYMGDCDPLLPPPALLRPGVAAYEDALAALALLPRAELVKGGEGWGDYVSLAMDTCTLVSHADCSLRFYPAKGMFGPEYYDARGRDWQREGVLRAWLAQVAVQAQSVEVAS